MTKHASSHANSDKKESFDTTHLEPIGNGTESRVYKYDENYALIITEYPFATAAKIQQLCDIDTKQILLPRKLLAERTYLSNLVIPSKNPDPLYNMSTKQFIRNIKVLKDDFSLLTDNGIALIDTGTYNTMFGTLTPHSESQVDDSIFLIDVNRFVSQKYSEPTEALTLTSSPASHNNRAFVSTINSILLDLITRPIVSGSKPEQEGLMRIIQAANYQTDKEYPIKSTEERLAGFTTISEYIDQINPKATCYKKQTKK